MNLYIESKNSWNVAFFFFLIQIDQNPESSANYNEFSLVETF